MARTFDGRRLRNARQAAHLKREQLALRVDRSVYAIHSYELGRQQPPVNVAARLADALGVSVDDLLTQEAVHVA